MILTAGHCVAEAGLDCRGYSWVFDYRLLNNSTKQFVLPKSNIYNCKQIIKAKVDDKNKIDYALIRLDRDVLDRKAVNIRLTGDVDLTTKLSAIGHPRGLPTKIAHNGAVLENMSHSIKTNLDTYTMNSGSGVFNESNGDLEGVLISGSFDFESATIGNSSCNKSKVYQNSEGNELVTKINSIWDDLDLL